MPDIPLLKLVLATAQLTVSLSRANSEYVPLTEIDQLTKELDKLIVEVEKSTQIVPERVAVNSQ